MGGSTAPTVALIVGTVEILNLRVTLIEMEVKITAAISTDQKPGEHIALAFVGAALANFAPLLLNLFKDRPLNDGFVDILEDDPVFPVIGKPLFVLVRLGVGLEVENLTAILLRENVSDGGTVPHIRSAEFAFPRAIDALFTPISDGGKDFLLGEYGGDLLRSIAIQSHSEYAADHLGGLLIHDPPFGIVGVFLVAIGR